MISRMDTERGLILPFFLMALTLLGLLQTFMFLEGNRSLAILGNYRKYLESTQQEYSEFVDMEPRGSDCQSHNNTIACFLPSVTAGHTISFSKLLEQASFIINCELSSHSFSDLPRLSPSSLSGFNFCKNLNLLNGVSLVKGNLQQPDNYLMAGSGRPLTVYTQGFFNSALKFSTLGPHRVIAYGDIFIPELICESAAGCAVELFSVSGQIIVSHIIGFVEISAAYRREIFLPDGYYSQALNLSQFSDIQPLPVAYRKEW